MTNIEVDMWDFSLLSRENISLQISQQKRRSPVWRSMWHFKLDDCVNVLLQTLQQNGRSPV